MEVGHSRLLKFFKEGYKTPKMEEIPAIKIQKEFKTPENIESEVPGTQTIRESDDKNTSGNSSESNSEIKITAAEFTLSPVITVTKKETSLTKGDLKLQKVTVTEDIAEDDLKNGGFNTSEEVGQLIHTNGQINAQTIERTEKTDIEKMDGEEKPQDEKKSKIPLLRLRQAVEKVKKEREAQKAREKPRRSSIPKLKDAKKVVKRDTSLKIEPRVDDEFDKLYEEIIDNKQKDIDDKLLTVTIDDPEKIETKFEEIIHAYDENEHEKHTVTRVSKIPALRRKDDERPSRIGALIDRAKDKSAPSETKLKDGGFKVTASTIRTKRFSRGNSRDLSKEEHQIEVTETIHIKESGDNDVFGNDSKTEKSTRITKQVIKDNKADSETIDSNEDGVSITTENLEKADGTTHKNKRFTRTISKEMRERRLNRDLNRNLEEVRKATSKKIKENLTAAKVSDIDDVIDSETPAKDNIQAKPGKEKIVRAVSREIKKDGQNISNTETVTVENLEDGGSRTITTKTIVTETLRVGEPVVTERIVRNISREVDDGNIETVVTTEEIKDGGTKRVTKEIVKGIPVKTERFTRGISREMGNIKPKINVEKEYVTKEENNTNDNKKEIKKAEQTDKEVKGIPVYTKVTRSFSKGKIHNVEMSRTIEWKPADVVTTKNYSRSVSEKVTKKELQDTDLKSFEKPPTINEDTDKLPQKSNTNDIANTENRTPKDPILEAKIKDTVKDIASKITTKKVTEYNTEEQVTNIEKNTFKLSKTGGLNIDDLKVSREIGTQMSVDYNTTDSSMVRDVNGVKEIGTQMSIVENTSESSRTDNIEAREIGTQVSVDFSKAQQVNSDRLEKEAINGQRGKEHTDLPKQEKDSYKAEVTILKGNVSRLKEKIAKDNVAVTKQEKEELPKKKSVLSKIAIFENLDPKEVIEVPTRKMKCKYVPPTKYQTNNEEIATAEDLPQEQPKPDSLADRNKVEIAKNYDEVTYTNEPKIVKEYLKTEQGYGQNEITEKTTVIHTSESTIQFEQNQEAKETATILPAIIDLKPEASEIGFAETSPAKIDSNLIDNKVENATTLPTDKETPSDKVLIRNDKPIEMPVIIPARINYEADIGKVKPGKINLNNWSSQVEINKSTVDKIEVFRSDSLQEIAATLPAKVNFKTDDSQIQVSETLPGKIDSKKEEIQYHEAVILPAKIGVVSTEIEYETAEILPGKIEYEDANVSNSNNVKTKEYVVENVTREPTTINIETDTVKIETPTIAPARLDNDVIKPDISKNKTNSTKPKPGKINLDLWKDKVEANKTVVNRTTIKINKNVESKFPGKVDFKSYDKQVKETQGNNVFHRREYKVEIAKTLPAQISLSTNKDDTKVTHIEQSKLDSNGAEIQSKIIDISPTTIDSSDDKIKIETPIILPAKLEFGTDFQNAEARNISDSSPFGIQAEEAKILPAVLQFETYESKAEINDTVQDNIYYSNTENKPESIITASSEVNVEGIKTIPGKLDLKAWENKVEVNKILVDKLEDFRSESQEEIAKTLPAVIDFKTYEITETDSDDNELNNNVYKVESPTDEDSHSYTIHDDDYDKRVDNLQTKTYSITEISKQSNTAEIISTETPFESYTSNETLSTKEFDFYSATNKTQNELTRSTSTYVTQDFKSIEDFKRTKSLIETTNQYTVNRIVTTENELNLDTHKVQNETNLNETNENVFNFDVNKVQNSLARSAYGEEDVRSSTEELKRAKSLAELDLGDAVNGKVRRIVGRIKSVDFTRRDSVKTEINIKEMPKKLSVLEKIALFEGKTSSANIPTTTLRSTTSKKPEMPVISEEDYLKKIEELNSGKTKYGRFEKMNYLALADGSKMPVLAVGTALLDPRLIKYQIGAAIDLGYRAIDTAFIYGNEKEVGEAIQAKIDDGTVRREDLYIISKLWSTFHRTNLVEQACRASLEKMGLEYFDLYMIHNPMSFKEGSDPIPKIATVIQYSQYDYLDAWFGLEDLVNKGLVRSIGLSNFNSQQIQRVLDKGRLKPMVNQVECHPYLTQERLDNFCAERNITLSAYGVLGSKGTPPEMKSSFTPVIDDAIVKVVASGLNVTPAQLLIRYQIERGHNVVVKASSAAHMWENMQALTFNLDRLQVNALHALNKNKRTFTFKG
uniref:NADP-dependent oxidoreductase domain-containing protein n=1 Tax=Heliothis virescens TaxID=7102 RepID=A0A2A4JN96_HELVI